MNLNLTCASKKVRKLDFYPTPAPATVALMEFLQLNRKKIVWEPAAGTGSMSAVIRKYVDTVIETDIVTGHDFMYTYRQCDAIITNPPFNLAQDFIEKALCEADIVCMLLKSQYWHAKKRLQLFTDQPPAYVCPLTWRVNFEEHLPIGEKKCIAPVMEVAWSIWIKGTKHKTIYHPLQKPGIMP